MRRPIGLCIGLLVMLAAGALSAQVKPGRVTGPAANIDPESLINSCVNKYRQELDSGVTGRMRAGSADIIDCLNALILDQVRATMPNPNEAAQRYQAYLQQLSHSHQRIWWEFYNENTFCQTNRCGTDLHVFHLGQHIGLLKDILRGIITHRQREGF
ncbi:hypothetical protein [Ferrovibrio sp.]|uniref:hypothetical protein n=1 Tax=Ferrovibrio sp. TaxID=1917215 RepID=UPI0025BE6427|nr:hypothetical protein [Ferrovibrio sp.]MBX3453907.1 hypothetical protein [Ferrovibrio sp.]